MDASFTNYSEFMQTQGTGGVECGAVTPWEADEPLVWVLVSWRTSGLLAFLLHRHFRLCSQLLAHTHPHPFAHEESRVSRMFRQAPRRLCLTKQEDHKCSHFTAWHEGLERVLQAHSTSARRHTRAHQELGSSLPPNSHRPFFHLAPPRTWWFGFPMPWRAARGLHLQAQSWLRAQRSSVGGA
jgi:hypothetical protein